MENTTRSRIKLGIFVSAGLLILIAAIYFIGQRRQLFTGTFQISGIFKDINGLQAGNSVRFSGITVGTVESIEQFTDSAVRVTMIIEEKSRRYMKKDVRATIGSDGLMGNKIITIIPGTAGKKQLEDYDVISTAQPVSMDEIMQNIKVSTDHFAAITEDMSAIVSDIRAGKGTIGKLFSDSLFAQDVDQAIQNIKQGAGGFDRNMNAASESVLLKGFFKKKKKPEETK
jgi:phospholipid/cholesterol/gamma-HCH transport system substrate-binding protein